MDNDNYSISIAGSQKKNTHFAQNIFAHVSDKNKTFVKKKIFGTPRLSIAKKK